VSSNASRPRPNTSYPGPKLAVEEDAVAVHDDDDDDDEEEGDDDDDEKEEESDFTVNL
jgi:hypothetical protein